MESDDALDSADGISEGAPPDDYDPDIVSGSDDDEDMSLSEDEDGNVVSKKPVARRGTTSTRSQAKAAVPAASKRTKPARAAAKKGSQKPATRRTRALPQALPNLIRKHDLMVFEDSSDEEAYDTASYSKSVDFRHLTLKQDHSHRHVHLTLPLPYL